MASTVARSDNRLVFSTLLPFLWMSAGPPSTKLLADRRSPFVTVVHPTNLMDPLFGTGNSSSPCLSQLGVAILRQLWRRVRQEELHLNQPASLRLAQLTATNRSGSAT